MAIDLPPSLPPELASAEQIHFIAAELLPVKGRVGDKDLHITGDHQLSAEDISAIIDAAKTPSQAILNLNEALHRQGRLLIKVLYSAPRRGVIHVHVLQQRLDQVTGDKAITGYFRGLAGDHNLTRTEFDTARIPANLHSERAGVDYSISYKPSTSMTHGVNLDFQAQALPEHEATDLIVQVGNQGSRFVGRYFVDAGLKHDFNNGTRLFAVYETAVTEWGESRGGEDYQQFQIEADRPFSFGLYGLEARHTQYERDLGSFATGGSGCDLALGTFCLAPSAGGTSEPLLLDAEIDQVALTGGQVLSSDLDHRLILSQRLEWTDSQIDTSTGESVQDETYFSASFGANYHRALRVGGKLVNWKAGAVIESGLGGDSGTLGTDHSSPGVSAGKRTADYLTLTPNFRASLAFSDSSRIEFKARAQFADEQLPQQQQWVLGGIDKMSAYLPGVVAGDTGYHLNAQYRYTWKLGFAELDTAVFAEYGSSQYENASGSGAGIPDLSSDTTLVDAGFRTTLRAFDTLQVQGVIAESISEKNISDEALERAEADFFIVVKTTF